MAKIADEKMSKYFNENITIFTSGKNFSKKVQLFVDLWVAGNSIGVETMYNAGEY